MRFPSLSSLKNETWDDARRLGAGAREIAGMTLGIVGVGEIGGRLAKIARDGFGMNVLGHQRRLDRLPARSVAFFARRPAAPIGFRGARLPADTRRRVT